MVIEYLVYQATLEVQGSMKHNFAQLHPELQHISNIPQISMNRRNLWLMRWLTRLLPRSKKHDGITIDNIHIPIQNGTSRIRLRIYSPAKKVDPTPALLWMHGGGYVIGVPEMDDHTCVRFARESNITVVSVDYRLAPQHPFPLPLEDCYSALQWINSNPSHLNIDTRYLAVGGTSAGAGLAASLAQLAYDRGEINPVFQLLVYPMLDDRSAIRRDLKDRRFIGWDQKSNQFGWESYIGKPCGTQDVPPYAIPSRRQDLAGMPPAWIGVGSIDLFHDESAKYAQRLKEANVECELVVVPGAFHGFDYFAPDAQVVQEFHKSQVCYLKKYLPN
jgi:acetyl esterase/lipase